MEFLALPDRKWSSCHVHKLAVFHSLGLCHSNFAQRPRWIYRRTDIDRSEGGSDSGFDKVLGVSANTPSGWKVRWNKTDEDREM